MSASIQTPVLESKVRSQFTAGGAAKKNDTSFYMPELDGLRTCAFLFVFMFHCWTIPTVDGGTNAFVDVYNKTVQWGFTGVDLFFVLSGYLITLLLLKERQTVGNISFSLYFKRRMLRIWPLFYLSLVIAAFAIPAFSHRHLDSPTYTKFLGTVALPMALWVGNYALTFSDQALLTFSKAVNFPVWNLIKPLWSVCIEEQFYLTWPWILKAAKNTKALFVAVVSLSLLTICCRYVFQQYSLHSAGLFDAKELYYCNTLCRIDPLMAGATVAIVQLHVPNLWTKLKRFGALFALAGFACLAAIVTFQVPMQNSVSVVPLYAMVAWSFGSILFAAMSWKPLRDLLSNPVLVVPGKITYGMYIVHHCIIVLVDRFFQKHSVGMTSTNFFVLKFAVSLLLTFAVAQILWLTFERRLHALRKRFARVNVI